MNLKKIAIWVSFFVFIVLALVFVYAYISTKNVSEISSLDYEPYFKVCAKENIRSIEMAQFCLSQDLAFRDIESKILEQELFKKTRVSKISRYLKRERLREIAFIIHYSSSILIFFLVCAMVIAGVWMSWKQLSAAISRGLGTQNTDAKVRLEGDEERTSDKNSETVIKALGGFELRTSIVGVVVLAFSLLFFNRYLEVVYPMTVLKKDVSENVSSKNEE